MFEAWRLAIEYLELVVTHQLGYEGSYARHLDDCVPASGGNKGVTLSGAGLG